mmetsp:Transcript_103975/g.298872  ORF Transcript_103975/g.298872 Transcript_103975/m.298872 type:complete len:318 (+) Transcript_103975:97-1050(+)|eukprot:CAMPEP_0177233460 /NCGR_PEP_ID=MMETSP0367-20130122/43878_1 /TAXON_ID=447022 ORGANISM="Scrippsiella hangoei-like, Strain SHHI-4" /NCGR_SAMPLE_ID=MMETSP0367 /ASSEMBLY_ACC=CAM_ASM_000362 /LENGTH=317 /DNA_ID=CAMNT_0018684195 /DNA_START=12 /DNA_END=965 /DNA_ORIENTATION=-
MSRFIFKAILLGAAAPIALTSSAVPTTACRDGPDGACPASEAGEEGSLLQIAQKQVLISGALDGQGAANGCPDSWQWDILTGIAQSVFSSKIMKYLPFAYNQTLVNETLKLGNCSGTAAGFGKMTLTPMVGAKTGMTLSKFQCNSATCKTWSWGVCTEYEPINITVGVQADSFAVTGYLDGTATLDPVCAAAANVSGTMSLNDTELGFTVDSPAVMGSGQADLIVSSSPNVSEVNVSSATVTWSGVSQIHCTMGGKNYTECFDTVDLLNSPEYQQKIQEAVDKSLATISEYLAGFSFSLLQHQLALAEAFPTVHKAA